MNVQFEGPHGRSGRSSITIGRKAVRMTAASGVRRGHLTVPMGEGLAAGFWFADAPRVGVTQIGDGGGQIQLRLFKRHRFGRGHNLSLRADRGDIQLQLMPHQDAFNVWLTDSISLGLDDVTSELAGHQTRFGRPPSALRRLSPVERELFDQLILDEGPVALGDITGDWRRAERDGEEVQIRRVPPQQTDRSRGEATHGMSTSSQLDIRARIGQARTLTLGDYAFHLTLGGAKAAPVSE